MAGTYMDNHSGSHAYFLSEIDGVWGRLQLVRGIGPLVGGSSVIESLSCPRAGWCSAVGNYWVPGGGNYLFVVNQRS
jgi:hypothetical protein